MQLLKQSVSSVVTIGPVLDSDGIFVSTMVVTDLSIAKNGSSAALTTETLSHIANGMYSLTLSATNTNTLGRLDVFVNNTAMAMTNHRYDVLVAATYDAVVTTGVATAAEAAAIQADTNDIQTRLPATLVGGRIDASVGAMASDVITAAALATDAVTEIVAGVYNALPSGSWTNGSFGDRLLVGLNNNRTVQVTGSHHIAADIHELQAGAITEGDFADGAISARVIAADAIGSSELAASAITEIQSGLATTTQLTTVETKIDTIDDFVDTEISAIKAKTDQLSFTVANQVDANALTGGGGGSGSIVVTPVVAQTPVRAVATTITTFKGDRSAITVGVFSGTSPVNLSTLGALEVCIQTKAGTDLQLIAAANITISGTDSNYFSFSPNATAVGTVGRFMWSLRVASSGSKQVIVYGAFVVEDAALAD
jgi:hypothetical protein